jgi:hypothetical protein
MNKLLSVLVLLLAACGSNDSGAAGTSPASIEGTWLDVVDASNAEQLTFAATTWKMQTLYGLTSGAFGMEVRTGTYTAAAGNVTMVLSSSSCVGVKTIGAKTVTGTYLRTGNSLALTIATSYLAFQLETAAPTGMGAATVGCVDASGNFFANAVAAVP